MIRGDAINALIQRLSGEIVDQLRQVSGNDDEVYEAVILTVTGLALHMARCYGMSVGEVCAVVQRLADLQPGRKDGASARRAGRRVQ